LFPRPYLPLSRNQGRDGVYSECRLVILDSV